MKILIILIYTAFLLITGSGCTSFDEDSTETQQIDDFPDQESWDTEMFFTRDGKRRAVLKAGYVAKYSKKRYTLLREGVKVNFYDSEGNPKSVLTSEEGKVFDDREDMVATGNVVVVSENGTVLYTEELIWKNNEERIISNVPVKITTETDTLFGDSFSSDPDLISYEITNARGTSDKTISIDE
jgi:LPS export ABC transporter protein LptC